MHSRATVATNTCRYLRFGASTAKTMQTMAIKGDASSTLARALSPRAGLGPPASPCLRFPLPRETPPAPPA